MVNPDQLGAELLLASIGLTPILEATPQYNAAAVNKAAKFLPDARADVLRFMGGDKDSVEKPAAFNYDKVRKLLDESDPVQQVDALKAALPDDIEMDVTALVTKIVEQLRSMLPRRIEQSSVRVNVTSPGPISLNRFRRGWAVANDPETVLRNLLQGTLTTDEVKTFEALFPAIYETVAGPGGTVDDCIATMKARRGDKWDLNEADDRLLKTLLGQSWLNKGLVHDLEAASAAAQQQAEPNGQPPQNAANARLSDAEQLPGSKPIG